MCPEYKEINHTPNHYFTFPPGLFKFIYFPLGLFSLFPNYAISIVHSFFHIPNITSNKFIYN